MVSLMNNEMEKRGRNHPMSNLIQYLSICLQALKKLQINLPSWPVLRSRHQSTSDNPNNEANIQELCTHSNNQSHDIMTEYFLILQEIHEIATSTNSTN